MYREVKSDYGFSTKSVHSGTAHDPVTRGVCSPLFVSSATAYPNKNGTIFYTRYQSIPNAVAAAKKVAALEGTEDGLIFSSGMAAITTTVLTFLKHGDHAIFTQNIYGGTHKFVTEMLEKFGIDVTVLADTSVSSYKSAIKKNTKLIYMESPSNPLLRITDIRGVVRVAKEHDNILTVIDNTFATPINQNPIALGVDIVIHSATKYLNGHSDLVCGVVVASKSLIEKINQSSKLFGGCLSGQDCYFLERGMKTLALRVKQQNHNAMKIAEYLVNKHPLIKTVHYPGLSSHPDHEIAKQQMRGFGGMLSFDSNLTKEQLMAWINNLEIVQEAVSLGGCETIIIFPAETSHAQLSKEDREKIGISDTLVRMSVGIEDVEDIIADMEQAFKKIEIK